MELTILMPCLNEVDTLETCILKAKNSIETNQLDAEIIIADNGSTDGSVEVAGKLGVKVVHVKNKGYGNALRAGIMESRGKYVIFGDADDTYDFSNIGPFVTKLREGFDLVMGNRFKGGIEKGAMPFLHRYLGNPVLSFIGRLFFKIPIGDFHCGLRGFNRESVMGIGLCTSGMEFASEMVVKAALNKLKVAEIPTKLHMDGRSRPPHLRTWRDGWRHLRFLLLFSPRWLFLYPGLLLILFGTLISATLLGGAVRIKSVNFDVHTMLYASAMVIIGFQMVTFYCFSKIFAINSGLDNHDQWLIRFNQRFSLEKGILIGLIIMIIGITLSVYSFSIWDKSSFGNLDPSKVLRIVIPAVTLLVLGVQLIFNSFLASILNLKTANDLPKG